MTTKLSKALGNFSETTIDDEIVVMRMDNGEFFSLTGTARAIWLLLDGTRDRARVLTDLRAQYGDANPSMEADLDAFLSALDTAGLLARS